MKNYLPIAVVALVIVAALVYFYQFRREGPASYSPVVNVPDVNPVEKTNPFADVKTNPFE